MELIHGTLEVVRYISLIGATVVWLFLWLYCIRQYSKLSDKIRAIEYAITLSNIRYFDTTKEDSKCSS